MITGRVAGDDKRCWTSFVGSRPFPLFLSWPKSKQPDPDYTKPVRPVLPFDQIFFSISKSRLLGVYVNPCSSCFSVSTSINTHIKSHHRSAMAESQVATNNKKVQENEDNLLVAAEMKPWEQHSAVISIPRYDYKAPASFVHRSFSGFLITCPIRREKSATKEAMSMLDKYLVSTDMCSSEGEKDPENVVPKRRKVEVSEKKECVGVIEKKNLDKNNEVSEGSCISSSKSDAIAERPDPLSLVKLTRSGLILLTFSHDHCPNVVDIVSNIMQSLESGSSKAPLWCHRILPIQTTCVLQEKELCTLVSKLVADFMKNEGKELVRPIKFAIGYNRRGIEETELKGANGDLNQVALLDRSRCFEVVASAVKSIVSDSVVDLKCPELTVLIELLPISGLPKGSPVVAVSVLPQKLIMTKPRLGIKALVHDMKSKK